MLAAVTLALFPRLLVAQSLRLRDGFENHRHHHVEGSGEREMDKKGDKVTTVKGFANLGHCSGLKRSRWMRKFCRFADSPVQRGFFKKD